jgi:predicted nucleic acid-binding protein
VTELVDTSALILARRNPDVGRLLSRSIEGGDLATCDIVELEYLMGARSAEDYAALEDAFAGFLRLPTERADWARAREVHRGLAGRGPGLQRSVRIPDLIIAAVAERHGIGVLHYDEDYDRITAITRQPTRWVVPRGSIGG